MVTVGIAADEEGWKRLELAWNAALPTDLPYIHMREFFRAYWERHDEADALIRKLVDIVKQETVQTFIIGLRRDHFDAVDKDYQLREYYGSPLTWVAGMCVWQTDTWVKTNYPEIAKPEHFHEKGDSTRGGEGGWTRCIQSLRQAGIKLELKGSHDENGASLVPFQCCDMIAWTYRRAMEDHLKHTMYRSSFWFQYMHEILPKGQTGTLDEQGLRELCEEHPQRFPPRLTRKA